MNKYLNLKLDIIKRNICKETKAKVKQKTK